MSELFTNIKETITRLVQEIKDDDVPGLSAEVAYHGIFSIPAVFILLVTLAAVIDSFADFSLSERLREVVNESAPEPTQDILIALIENAVERVSGGFASLGVILATILALWSGSNGVATLMKSFNRAYDTAEDRPFVRKKLVAIGLTVLLGVMVNLAFFLWVFGYDIGEWIARQLRLGATFDTVWNMSRWPLATLLIILILTVLYHLGPNIPVSFRWALPGAVLATIIWAIVVFGLSIYLQFGNPGSAYGALGGLIVFLFFLYLTGIAFIVGAEFNSVLAERYASTWPETQSAQDDEPEQRAVPS